MRSKVEPMKDVVRLIRRHFDGIVAWTQTRQTNGFIEAINGLFQAAKRKARGYGRFETMRTVLFLIAGKLNFAAFHEHARGATSPTPFSKEPDKQYRDVRQPLTRLTRQVRLAQRSRRQHIGEEQIDVDSALGESDRARRVFRFQNPIAEFGQHFDRRFACLRVVFC